MREVRKSCSSVLVQCLPPLSFSNDILHEMGATLRDLKVEKDSIGWGLEELEAAARDAVYGESDSDDES
jgi:hypothetical protein